MEGFPMIHEEKKITNIVEELTLYLFAAGANHIRSEICLETHQVIIRFQANYHPDSRNYLEHLEKYLNGEKNRGMEDIYWELAGSGDAGDTSQLLLVGMMLEKAEITFEDQEVFLTLYKNL
jgi:hypothetical protein